MKNKQHSLFFAFVVLLAMPLAALAQAAPASAPPASPQPSVAPVTTVSTSATITTSSAETATTSAATNTSSAANAVSTTASSANNATQPQAAASGGNSNGPQTGPGAAVNTIVPAPMLMSYSTVKDAFGRRIADNFLVIHVTITNSDITHQFLLQDLMVVFDPNECEKGQDFYRRLKVQECYDRYDKYLKYPIAYSPMSQPTLQAVAAMGQYRNPRNFFFKSLDFAATMGGALTGFNFVGRDGKAGLSVFNGTFLTASKTLLPDLTVGQLTQLNDQAYRPNTLVETKESKNYCVFLPANQLFTKENWDAYRHGGFDKKERAKNEAALELIQIMQLTLTARVSGVAIKPADDRDQPSKDPGTNSKRLQSASGTPSGPGSGSSQPATTSAGPTAPASTPVATATQPNSGSSTPPRTPQP